MIRLAFPVFLWGLALIPFFWLLFGAKMAWKRKAIKRFGEPALVRKLMPDQSNSKSRLKFLLMTGAFIFLVVGLADPQIGSKYEEVKRQGIDLVIALDVSNSMLAEDIRPNRLERARQAIYKLLDKLEDDRVGIVVFAGEAYLQLPFTSDYAAARLFLGSITTESVPVQGTSIGEAIDISVRALPKGSIMSKAIIIISDGEDHEDLAIDEAKKAKEAGIFVHTLGIGTPAGAPVPDIEEGVMKGYKTDENGTTVISRMNPEIMQEIARAGGGQFVQSTNGDVGLETLFNQISSMEKSDFGTKAFTDYEDRFQLFIAFAFLLLIFELVIDDRRSAIGKRMNLFGSKKVVK